MKIIKTLARASILGAALAMTVSAHAAENGPVEQTYRHIETEWAKNKYLIADAGESKRKMDALGVEADAFAARFPDHVEALIWDGIITSERASMANPISALSLAKRALALLEKAEAMDPMVLDAGAPTSLGVLYYRVPGFPIAFGDAKKARRLLMEAVKNAPTSMDAHYFYGDFLNEQGEYAKAATELRLVLSMPPHPDRPVWDKYRRIVADELLAKATKSASK